MPNFPPFIPLTPFRDAAVAPHFERTLQTIRLMEINPQLAHNQITFTLADKFQDEIIRSTYSRVRTSVEVSRVRVEVALVTQLRQLIADLVGNEVPPAVVLFAIRILAKQGWYELSERCGGWTIARVGPNGPPRDSVVLAAIDDAEPAADLVPARVIAAVCSRAKQLFPDEFEWWLEPPPAENRW